MLNEKRVKLMVKLASYEQQEGKEDFKVSSYYKKDYVSLNSLCTFLWMTAGYVILLGMLGIVYMEPLLDNFTIKLAITVFTGIVAGYVVLIVVYSIIAHSFYQKKHNESRRRVKQYSHNLLVLGKLYEKEKA